ncbi:MAG: chemotaxis protein CheW [Bryobacteraceae bacterium]|jgi:purine-binding chemotaxis protein CheW
MTIAQVERTAQTTLLATFFVRDALCALDAAGVQEVIRLVAVTPVRHASDEVAGVINLRGKIVTLLDIGMVLGLGRAPASRDSRVFIVEDRTEFLGLLVDRVGEVLEVDPELEEPLPVNIPAAQARFFRGVYRANGHVIALLNPITLLAESRT